MYHDHSPTSNLLGRLPWRRSCVSWTIYRVGGTQIGWAYLALFVTQFKPPLVTDRCRLRTQRAGLRRSRRGDSDYVFRRGKGACGRPRAASPELREDGEAGRVPKLHPSIQAALRWGRRGQRAEYLHLRLHLPQGLRAEVAVR